VDLTVAGTHLGLYTVVEHVDTDFLQLHFDDDGGDLYKPDQPGGTLKLKGTTFDSYQGVEIQTNEDTTDHSAFLTFIEALNNGSPDEYTALLDVDVALKYLALNTALVNLDSYPGSGHNYYLYEQDGVFSIIIWDLNEAFGNFTCGCNQNDILGFVIDEPTCGPPESRPLVSKLLELPELKEAYRSHLQMLIEGPFSPNEMSSRIHAAADLIRPYVEADNTKFYSTMDFENALTQNLGQVIGLEHFVEQRTQHIADQLAGQKSSTANGAGNCKGGGPGGPGGGGGGGGHPKCPDGICDQFEQDHPEACPEDCE